MLFNPVTILTMAKLSSMIYCHQDMPIFPDPSATASCLPIENENIVYFHENSTTAVQMAICQNDIDKRVSVVFRGTEAWTDWKYNLQILPKKLEDHPGCRIHTGIYKQIYPNFDIYYNATEGIISELPDYEVFVTGHSSAAVHALLTAYLLSLRLDRTINTIGFCGPALINKKFRDKIEQQANIKCLRITHGKDIVPHLIAIVYKHTKNKIHFEQKYATKRLPRLFSIKDHMISNVIKSLQKYNNES